MVTFFIGDLLTGKRLQVLPVTSGSWSAELNAAGEVSATVLLSNPAVKRLGLRGSASPGKAFLAAVEGDLVLQAGPIWEHQFSDDSSELTLSAAGMWSYFDHRVLLPVLAGRLPSDPTTDTNLTSSLQGIARAWVAQAQSWTGGNVPVILPTEIPGTNVRNEAGANVAFVGERLKQLTEVEDGPDIMFAPRFNTARDGVEWVLRIGTPTQPMLYGSQSVVFNVGVAASPVSDLKITTSGTGLGSQSFATGGRGADEVLIAVGSDATLTGAGFPLLDLVDSSHATVSEAATLQGYADELVVRGRQPIESWSFVHDLSQRPYLAGYDVGDFAEVRVTNNRYLDDGSYVLRVTRRSGDAEGKKVSLGFQSRVGG